MNNFEHRVLRIEPINNAVQGCASRTFPLYRPSRSLEQFLTQSFLRIESTNAVQQRCARKSADFASGSKIVGEKRGEMENFLVTQDSKHRGFC